MNRNNFLFLTIVFMIMFFQTPMLTHAIGETPTVTVTETPTELTGTKKNGFVTKNGKTYYYKNNKKKKGFQEIEGKTYYFDKKGIMLFGFQKINGSTYYFKSNGVMAKGLTKINNKTYYFDKNGKRKKGFRTIKKKKYYFNNKGVMVTGFQTIKKKDYYFDENGVMQTGLINIGKRYYYFDESGVMQTGFQDVNDNTYYFNSKGIMMTGLKKIKKKYYYFDENGVMQTGFVDIKSVTYYFDENTGEKFMPKKNNTIKKVDNIYAAFNVDGSYQITASYVLVKGKKMQVQYYSDPQVSDEKLLAAILYSEAGNQKDDPVRGKLGEKATTFYKGQLAVGYVILNRITPTLNLKEVIYQQYQFEPARTGVLTHYLENYNLVSKDCKNAAKVLLNDYKKETDSIPDFKRSDFTWKNFWALYYAETTSFFSVYSQEEYFILQGHVFFNYTKTIP